MSDAVKEFWREFCEKSELSPETPYQAWYFGNSAKMARELAELVISGQKTATASLVEFNEKHPQFAPVDDGYSVITDFNGNPLCIIQTTEIRHLPFIEVDARFAFDEGEDDRTLEDWRDGHWLYFTREVAENALEFNENSLVCCERFKLLYSK
jgi:uncharacterized protein YhfF